MMTIIEAGTSGHAAESSGPPWTELGLDAPWPQVARVLSGSDLARPVQAAALAEARVLDSRRHLVVAAPTNGGKSLPGLLVLLDAVRKRRRAVLIEPLRAIAREKTDEVTAFLPVLQEALGVSFRMRLSTGDIRLDDEAFCDPPPGDGELVVATPERFEALLRNPANEAWVASVGAVCVDEAHLISDPRRGATLEFLITSLLCLPVPPRIVLLSATIGQPERAAKWLSPCDLVSVTERCPPLRKQVMALDDGEEPNVHVETLVRDALAEPGSSVLVFVYQTRSAEALAQRLGGVLNGHAGVDGPLAYHAQMSTERRAGIRDAYVQGRSRCLVTTTALALGVNLPATHVFVRDSTFPGVGRLEPGQVLQMMGRAGRGDRSGHAVVLVGKGGAWGAEQLAEELRAERVAPFESSYSLRRENGRRDARREWDSAAAAAPLVASLLARREEAGFSLAEVEAFFARSLAGSDLARETRAALAWLTDPSRALAYTGEEGRCHLTVLGLAATRAVLPLPIAAGLGQLVRDMLTIDPTDASIRAWRPLDHLIVLHLLHGRVPPLRQFGAALADRVDAWMEQNPALVPVLYRNWIVGGSGKSRAVEVLGSLGVGSDTAGARRDEDARKAGYLAAFRSVVLWERSQGAAAADLERRWGVKELTGVEERWRDDMLWLLSGVAKLLDVRSFYYHLREECAADPERVRRVKGLLRGLRGQVYDLQEELKYCSALGPTLLSLRRSRGAARGPSVGAQTIRRLEEAGVTSFAQLAGLSVDDMVKRGVRRGAATQIRGYVRRRQM